MFLEVVPVRKGSAISRGASEVSVRNASPHIKALTVTAVDTPEAPPPPFFNIRPATHVFPSGLAKK